MEFAEGEGSVNWVSAYLARIYLKCMTHSQTLWAIPRTNTRIDTKEMKNGFWIFKRNLIGIVAAISDLDNFDIGQSELDEIKYGLTGTSDEKGNWFEYRLNKLSLKLALDQADTDIVHIELSGDIEPQTVELLSGIGTRYELRTIDRNFH